jgi:hypothetical protein
MNSLFNYVNMLIYVIKMTMKRVSKLYLNRGQAVVQWVEALRYLFGRSRVRFLMVLTEFFMGLILLDNRISR